MRNAFEIFKTCGGILFIVCSLLVLFMLIYAVYNKKTAIRYDCGGEKSVQHYSNSTKYIFKLPDSPGPEIMCKYEQLPK